MQYLSIIEGTPIDFLSRLFLYFNAREMEGSIKDDAGAMLRDVIKSVATQGVCLETLWPYVVERFAIKPDAACYDAAVAVRALSYSRIGPSIRGMKSALAGGRPFVFGSMLYSSFETPEVASTGVVPMPVPEEQPVGGHAMMVVGYDDATNLFKVRNSWDIEWGDKGYCYMPYAYLGDHNLTDDRWVIQKSS
jgi:C1A family cysteine protease